MFNGKSSLPLDRASRIQAAMTLGSLDVGNLERRLHVLINISYQSACILTYMYTHIHVFSYACLESTLGLPPSRFDFYTTKPYFWQFWVSFSKLYNFKILNPGWIGNWGLLLASTRSWTWRSNRWRLAGRSGDYSRWSLRWRNG